MRGMAQVPSQPQSERTSLSSGFTASMPQMAPGDFHQLSSQMWPTTPQTFQHWCSHDQQAQQSTHLSQNFTSRVTQLSTSDSEQQGAISLPGIPGMVQDFPAPSPYDHEAQLQYIHQGSTPSPPINQARPREHQPQQSISQHLQWWRQQS
jgi:hypothetical protein